MKPVGELLSGQKVHTLSCEATVLEATRTMTDRHVGALLVTGKNDELVGIFTERDLMARVVVEGKDPEQVKLSEVMTSDLFTAEPTRTITEVAQELQDRHIRHLPVVEEGRVVGVLSLRDLLRAHLAVKTQEVNALTAYIQGEEVEVED